MSREWEEVNISETIMSSNTGLDAIKRAPIVDYDSGIKCLRIQDISQEKSFDEWGFCKIEDRNYSKFQLKKGDIIVARTGATIGVNKIIKKDLKAVYNNGLIRIKVNKNIIDSNYLYYNMQGYNYKGHIQAICAGTSTQPNMKMNDLLRFTINLPPLNEQKAIAHILSTLDEKIETNNQINKTLEKMAQTTFKHWFVDFEFPNEDGEPYKTSGGEMVESELGMIPKGWEVSVLKDIASMKNGVNYSREQNGNEVKVVNVRDFNGSLIINKSKLDSIYLPEKQINDYLLKKYDTVVVRSAKPGETLLVLDKDEIVYSGFTIRVRTNKELLKLYVFYSIRNAMGMLNNSSNGTVFKNLNQQILGSLKVIVPKSNIVETYNSFTEPFLHLINERIIETCNLINLRDLLLPKLMSGEIRVSLKGDDIS